MSHKRRSALEKKIQTDIELELGAEPDVLLLRNSVGASRFVNEETGKEYWVPYGLGKGSPDIVALLTVSVVPSGASVGRQSGMSTALAAMLLKPKTVALWFCLEVKADEGDVDPEQEKCHGIWRRFGALIFTVRSREEARAALERARRLES